jgi:F-type H+-transporting ATPase subunit gamma
MAGTHDIRRRIRSIGSTSQITKAMQMVAASKMRKAQEAALAGRPFVQLMYRFQREATTQMREFRHPLLEVRPIRKRAVILIAADKGLCGALNSNLFRLAAQFDPESTVFIPTPRKDI